MTNFFVSCPHHLTNSQDLKTNFKYCRNKSDDTMVIPQVEVTLSSSTPEMGLIDKEDLITSGEQIRRSSSLEHKKSNFILSKKR